MSVRLFISCDICNTDGHHAVTETAKPDSTHRRRSDGRASVSGNSQISNICRQLSDADDIHKYLLEQAMEKNWVTTSTGQHFCKVCYSKHKVAIERFRGEITELDIYIMQEEKNL